VTVLRLAALFWRRARAAEHLGLLLTAAGVAAALLLTLLALSVPPALGSRMDRQAWHTGDAPTSGSTSGSASGSGGSSGTAEARMVRRVAVERYRDREITRVELAPTGVGTPPPPPGLAAFPEPGTVWRSPALARLEGRAPPAELAERWPGRRAGTIGAAGLGHRDELLVVVGREAATLGEPDRDGGLPVGHPDRRGVTALADFPRAGVDADLDTYVTLARLAAVLLVVPTLGLLGAAARLTAARREQRLATLRLAGATPAVVTLLAAVEVASAAAIGAAVGVLGYLVALPAFDAIPLAGGPFSLADLRLGPAALLGALVLTPLLAALAAVVALRGVATGPLGVRRRTTPRRPSTVRLAAIPVAWAFFLRSAVAMREGGGSTVTLLGLGLVIATLAVVGPWLAWLLGTLERLLGRRAPLLIAGRRTVADPRGAYRAVSGMVLAGLIAGFLFGVLPTLRAASIPDHDPVEVQVVTPAPRLAALRAALDRVPGASAVHAGSVRDERVVDIRVPEGRLDEVRTAVTAVAPETRWLDDLDLVTPRTLLDDLDRAAVLLSLAALALAATSIAIGTTAATLDQREALARLRLIGVPIRTLQRARRWQVLVPLATASTGAMALGSGAGIVLLAAFGADLRLVRPPDWRSLAGLGLAGIAVGLAVTAAGRPLLVRVSRPTPRGPA